ncbi:hypothetical protein VTJ49DRAFT_882 [Mycothermus thermophilus]|uniref:Uncharacterized protein n=1 Tax=Humicola insolens TaxID=85995 RepID=A0ABR3VNW0_HUMIN
MKENVECEGCPSRFHNDELGLLLLLFCHIKPAALFHIWQVLPFGASLHVPTGASRCSGRRCFASNGISSREKCPPEHWGGSVPGLQHSFDWTGAPHNFLNSSRLVPRPNPSPRLAVPATTQPPGVSVHFRFCSCFCSLSAPILQTRCSTKVFPSRVPFRSLQHNTQTNTAGGRASRSSNEIPADISTFVEGTSETAFPLPSPGITTIRVTEVGHHPQVQRQNIAVKQPDPGVCIRERPRSRPTTPSRRPVRHRLSHRRAGACVSSSVAPDIGRVPSLHRRFRSGL